MSRNSLFDMKIIIIANFTLRLDGSREGRFCYIADALAKRGHSVELVVTDFAHGPNTRRTEPRRDLYPFRITVCHEPGYKINVSIKRLYSHWVWGRNVYKYLKSVEKPDLIYCAIPSLTAAKLAAKYCQKNGVKFVTDVQDLWPEAFCMAIHNKLLQKLFLPIKISADKAYGASDLAVAVSDTYVNRTLSVNKKGAKGVSVFLGNDGALFESERGKYNIGREGDELLLCYVGGLKDSYDIPCVIDAMVLVEANEQFDQNVRFVVIGDGPFRPRFEQYAKEKQINCTFLGYKPYTEMASLLCSCDICINPIVKDSAASIINKVGDYALSGLPVINTQESLEYRALIEEYNCGINCECGNSKQVADAIIKLANDPELRNQMAKGSTQLAKEKFDRRNTYMKIIETIENL